MPRALVNVKLKKFKNTGYTVFAVYDVPDLAKKNKAMIVAVMKDAKQGDDITAWLNKYYKMNDKTKSVETIISAFLTRMEDKTYNKGMDREHFERISSKAFNEFGKFIRSNYHKKKSEGRLVGS